MSPKAASRSASIRPTSRCCSSSAPRGEGAGPALSVNRRAPLLVDLRRHLGFQVVLPRPDYAVRHPIAA